MGEGGRGEWGRGEWGEGGGGNGEWGEGGMGGGWVKGIKKERGWGSREFQKAKAGAQTRSEQLPRTRVLVKAFSSKHG